jgi:hypothetical protein
MQVGSGKNIIRKSLIPDDAGITETDVSIGATVGQSRPDVAPALLLQFHQMDDTGWNDGCLG